MPNRSDRPVPNFVGFANAPLDEDGNHIDFRDVDGVPGSADVYTPSSIVAFHTEDKATDGPPSAVVPAPVEDEPVL